ncbi:hypothetical protein GCM10007276_30060 [Agaricicola taiwanensis]|uniref:Uncharacterized protein n=1 Tax=Agaricicola taiwanensis TaxID=591372 RepID=A0A8J2YLI4_9RHOB|nr:hypothetical protein [Agaricicola taiwanensis]GGE51035.1 hypothetical protein GCM10007276_30060 [Agaricicola taiwanensis]
MESYGGLRGLELRRKRLREVAAMRRTIESYRAGNLCLHTLVNDLESLVRAIEDDTFLEKTEQAIINLEIVNAISRQNDEPRPLTEEDLAYIEEQLVAITAEINLTRF